MRGGDTPQKAYRPKVRRIKVVFYPAEHVRRIELDAKCIYKHRNAGNLNKFEMRG